MEPAPHSETRKADCKADCVLEHIRKHYQIFQCNNGLWLHERCPILGGGGRDAEILKGKVAMMSITHFKTISKTIRYNMIKC